MYSNKNMRGGSNVAFNITNSDINASWLTMTSDTITANDNLYVGTTDVMATLALKQNILDVSESLTMYGITATTGNIETLTTTNGTINNINITISKYNKFKL